MMGEIRKRIAEAIFNLLRDQVNVNECFRASCVEAIMERRECEIISYFQQRPGAAFVIGKLSPIGENDWIVSFESDSPRSRYVWWLRGNHFKHEADRVAELVGRDIDQLITIHMELENLSRGNPHVQ